MSRTLLITGGTGALGPPLVAELLRTDETARVAVLVRPGRQWDSRIRHLRDVISGIASTAESCRRPWLDRLVPIAGDVTQPGLGLHDDERNRLLRDVHVVIHAAANTRFSASACDLRHVNVEGTRHVVEFARRCHLLEQLLFCSTTCVAGTQTGTIAEGLGSEPHSFVNSYERSKWEAERVVAAADVPARIVRLSTCIGGAQTGDVHRFGAIHQAIKWLIRGLVPMVPAVDGSRVDLIATDVAVRWIARATMQRVDGVQVGHVAAGASAIPVRDLLDCAVAHLRDTHPGWKTGQIPAPLIVDVPTFQRFECSVAQSGDVLFLRVLDAAGSFFPSLLYPKVYQTAHAETVWGGPLPVSDWPETLRKVIDFGCSRTWRGRRAVEPAHA